MAADPMRVPAPKVRAGPGGGTSRSAPPFAVDDLLGVLERVFDIGDAALLGGGEALFQRVLVDAQERHDQVLGHLLAVEDLLGDPEGQRRDAGRDRDRHGLVAVGVLLFLPPGELVLAVAHDDEGRRAVGGLERLGRAIAVAALGHHGDDILGQAGQDAGDGLLRHVLRPVAMHRADDLELRVLGDALVDALGDLVVDEHAGEAADLEQIAAIGILSLRYSISSLPICLKSTAMRQAQGSVTMPSKETTMMPASQASLTAPLSAVGEAALTTMAL